LTPAPDPTPAAFDDDLPKEIRQHLDLVEPGHIAFSFDPMEQLAGHPDLLTEA
jgi:hypothetical protein